MGNTLLTAGGGEAGVVRVITGGWSGKPVAGRTVAYRGREESCAGSGAWARRWFIPNRNTTIIIWFSTRVRDIGCWIRKKAQGLIVVYFLLPN